MKEYFDCLILTHGTAFGVGAAIFLLTILLVAKRVIGFVLSVILMLIALGASWSINNEALVRSYLDKWIPATGTQATRTTTTPAPSVEQAATPSTTTSQSVQPSADNLQDGDYLKGQVESEKARIQDFLEDKHPNINPAK